MTSGGDEEPVIIQPDSWRAPFRFSACIETMNPPRAVACRDSVVECGSPLPLFLACTGGESARGLAQSKTWRPCSGSWKERGYSGRLVVHPTASALTGF